MNSQVLEQRGVPNRAQVGETDFCSKYATSSKKYGVNSHYAWRHTMRKEWAQVMGQKTWGTYAEET